MLAANFAAAIAAEPRSHSLNLRSDAARYGKIKEGNRNDRPGRRARSTGLKSYSQLRDEKNSVRRIPGVRTEKRHGKRKAAPHIQMVGTILPDSTRSSVCQVRRLQQGIRN